MKIKFTKSRSPLWMHLENLLEGDTFKVVYNGKSIDSSYMKIRFASSFSKEDVNNLVDDDKCAILELNTGTLRMLSCKTEIIPIEITATVQE